MTESLVTVGDLKKATRGNKARICGDLSRLNKHLDSVENGRKHGNTCVVCGDIEYSFCKLCGNKAMQFFLRKGSAPERTAS